MIETATDPLFTQTLNLAPYDMHMRILHHLGRHVTGPGMRVLDAGCNTGELGEQYKVRYGAHVTGVEYDAGAAEVAKRRLDRVLVGDLEKIARDDLPRDHFDIVMAHDVLEHLYNPGETVRSMAACLKPGGVMILSVPNVANVGIRLGLLTGRFDYDKNTIVCQSHLRFFALHSARALLTGAGLKIETVEATPGLFTFRPYHATLERALGRFPWYRRFEHRATQVFKNLFGFQFLLVGRKAT